MLGSCLTDPKINLTSPIPNFQQIGHVKLDNTNHLLCSYSFFERVGRPCWYALAAICFVDPTYIGPTKQDVSVWWWKSYFYLGYRKDMALQSMTTMFNHLSVVDISEPLLPVVHSTLPTLTLVVNKEDHHFLQEDSSWVTVELWPWGNVTNFKDMAYIR